jgi:hypothetical protein
MRVQANQAAANERHAMEPRSAIRVFRGHSSAAHFVRKPKRKETSWTTQ